MLKAQQVVGIKLSTKRMSYIVVSYFHNIPNKAFVSLRLHCYKSEILAYY